MTPAWKSFWLGTLAAVIIAVAAGIILSEVNPSAGSAFSTSNTRL